MAGFTSVFSAARKHFRVGTEKLWPEAAFIFSNMVFIQLSKNL
jgi:hypothetical protein